jgi:hypothetical protein
MKHLLITLLLAAPAAAQSIDPIAYGKRFCELRLMEVDADAARKAAVAYAYDPNRSADGMKADTRAAAQYVVKHCRGLLE